MTPLEELTEKIQKAIPEIMELKFGCVLDDIVLNGEYRGYGVVIKDNRENGLYMSIDAGEQLEFEVHMNDKFSAKILGRDIMLDDILIILNILCGLEVYSEEYCTGAKFYIRTFLGSETSEKMEWILGKPLHLQEEKTIIALGNIIK